MNELPLKIRDSHILIYADDVKLFRPVKNTKDCASLQRDVDSFVQFCSECGLTVNAAKCSSVKFTKKRSVTAFDYTINNQPVMEKSSVKDLGVIFDNKMTFNKHIETTASRAMSIYGMTKRYCHDFSDPHAILAIYFGLARSILEYASVIWTPVYEVHKKRVERVQKLFIRYAVKNVTWGLR